MKAYKLINHYEGSSAEIGEVVYLSQFGEYCPNNSLRGYTREEIENNPNWQETKPTAIIGSGVEENKWWYSVSDDGIRLFEGKKLVCNTTKDNEGAANAELICEAVNNYQALRDSNAELLKALEDTVKLLEPLGEKNPASFFFMGMLHSAINKAQSIKQ